jgi:hypothetical protein
MIYLPFIFNFLVLIDILGLMNRAEI